MIICSNTKVSSTTFPHSVSVGDVLKIVNKAGVLFVVIRSPTSRPDPLKKHVGKQKDFPAGTTLLDRGYDPWPSSHPILGDIPFLV